MANLSVEESEYDEDWISSAWGETGNAALLRSGKIESRPRVQRAIQLARLHTGISLLDIACGRGEVPAIVCQHKGKGVGLDYSQASIKFAQKVKAVHQCGNEGRIELIRADATKLPFESNSFDRITMLDIIEHLYPEQLENMFLEVKRVLKPMGFAVIHTLPNRWVYDVTYPLFHKFFKKIPNDPRGPFEKKIHINEQDLPRLHSMLQKVGLYHRIWLEQHIPKQARWNSGKDSYNDSRDTVYPILAGPVGRFIEALSYTPFKLGLCNDIFGILWKGTMRPSTQIPSALLERLICRLLG